MASDTCRRTGKILMLSRLQIGSGNKSTLDRIRNHLQRSSYECVSVHTDDIKCLDDLKELGKKFRFTAAVGLHAYLAGQWLKDLGHAYILIFGGTDLSVCSRDATKLNIMKEAVECASFLVAFSEHMVVQADSLWPSLRNDKRLRIIPQGITVFPAKPLPVYKQYGIPDGAKILTMVGAVRPVKDQLYLLDAFTSWHQQTKTSCYLVIVGSILDVEYGEVVLKKVSGSPGVIFMGSLSLQDTHSLIQQSFALVNSSTSEGQATAVLEAQALKTPVIVRNIPGNMDIVKHGQTGLIYSTPEEFIQQLERLINDEVLAQYLVDKAADYVYSRHSTEQEKLAYLELIAEIVDHA